MSHITESAEEFALRCYTARQLAKLNKNDWWRSANGDDYIAQEMTDKHLIYCIAKIKRDNWRTQWLPRLELELRLREMAIERDQDRGEHVGT